MPHLIYLIEGALVMFTQLARFLCFLFLLQSSFVYGSLNSGSFAENYVYATPEARLSFIQDTPVKEKVGQLFMGIVYGKRLAEAEKIYLKESSLGNVILFNYSNSLDSFEQVQGLSSEIHKEVEKNVGIMPFISVDQEGGIVQRLKQGFSVFPGNMALAATKDPYLAFRQGERIGEELRLAGINMNLSPVVDVNTCFKNPVIGIRAFSNDPLVVEQLASKSIEGMKSQGILPVLKHYAGHGGASGDSHTELPTIDKSLEELRETDGLPFKMLAKKVAGVMTAHVVYPEVDRFNSATFSSFLLKKMLREEMGFEGLVVSDSLVMNGVVGKAKNFEEAKERVAMAAVSSFQAGCDLFIVGKLEWQDWEVSETEDQELISFCIDYFYKKVQEGEISVADLNDRFKRIIDVKKTCYLKLAVLEKDSSLASGTDDLGDEISKKAITLASSKEMFDLYFRAKESKTYLIVAPSVLKEQLIELSKIINLDHQFHFIDRDSFTGAKALAVSRELHVSSEKFDRVMLLVGRRQWDGFFSDLVSEFIGSGNNGAKSIVVGLDFPYPLIEAKVPQKALTYFTYSQSRDSLKNMFNYIDRGIEPSGTLPLNFL
jgi:beta-N-acetylhexosaminidase